MSVGPFTRRSILSAAAALAATPAVIAPARAQSEFPNRPIHLVVGFAAGGGNDIFARLVGAKLSEILGQPVIVENKPGAGGRLAPEYVTQQAADGYTLFVGPSGAMAVAAAIYPDLKYSPTKSFVPLAMIASGITTTTRAVSVTVCGVDNSWSIVTFGEYVPVIVYVWLPVTVKTPLETVIVPVDVWPSPQLMLAE